MEGKVVFDYEAKQIIGEGDRGRVCSGSIRPFGQIPDCLPKELGEMVERIKNGGISSSSEETAINKGVCQCGKHVWCCAVMGSDVWPEKQEVKIRVIEKD